MEKFIYSANYIQALNGLVVFDRDSTLIEDPGKQRANKYINFLPQALRVLRKCHEYGFQVCIASNQRAVSQGFVTNSELVDYHKQLCDEILLKSGLKILEIVWCPHPIEAECVCRKPKPGMISYLLSKYHLSGTPAAMFGDSVSDILAAEGAGITGILVNANDIEAEFDNWLEGQNVHK